MLEKLKLVWIQETSGLHLRLFLARLVLFLFPVYVGSRIRPIILKIVGFKIGSGTLMVDLPTISGTGNIYRRLKIGRNCFFNLNCLIDLSAEVVIGNNVSLGQQVMVLTNSHKLDSHLRRAGNLIFRPVHINDGVWVGARCTILPGVTIGPGAVIAAGAVVTADVEANTMVGGVPARLIRQLD